MESGTPGWYEDPSGQMPYRWWDGEKWSPYARSSEVQWDPIDSQAPVARRPGLPSMGVALICFALAVGLSFTTLAILRAHHKPGGRSVELVLAEVALWVPMLGACWFVSRRRGERSLSADFGLRWRPLDIGLGLAGSLAARSTESIALLPVILFQPHFRVPEVTQFSQFTNGVSGWIVLALVTCVGAPVVEELFFRGLIQTRLVGRYGPIVGIGVTSVLFGAAHLIGWSGPISLVYALAIAGAGVALGTMRHITGRLGTSMMTHSFFNAQALLILAFVHSTPLVIR